MSTEVIVARHMSIDFGISVQIWEIKSIDQISHDEVLEAAHKAEPKVGY
jgi:purine-nucleoside phosphorylase